MTKQIIIPFNNVNVKGQVMNLGVKVNYNSNNVEKSTFLGFIENLEKTKENMELVSNMFIIPKKDAEFLYETWKTLLNK